MRLNLPGREQREVLENYLLRSNQKRKTRQCTDHIPEDADHKALAIFEYANQQTDVHGPL